MLRIKKRTLKNFFKYKTQCGIETDRTRGKTSATVFQEVISLGTKSFSQLPTTKRNKLARFFTHNFAPHYSNGINYLTNDQISYS